MSFQNIQAQFQAEFENIQKNLNGKRGSDFNTIRTKSFAQFQQLGIPTVKHEDWKYSNLKNLDKIQFSFNPKSSFSKSNLEVLPFASLAGISICFVNGVFNEQLSQLGNTPKIKVLTLEAAVEQIPDVIEKHYGKYIETDKE